MNDQQPFIGPDDRPLAHFPPEAGVALRGGADGFNAVRLLLALIDDDDAEAARVLHEASAVPLLSGVAGIALVLGKMLADDDPARLRRVLDLIALSPQLDHAGTADAYRSQVTG